jgi:hypothetical protein
VPPFIANGASYWENVIDSTRLGYVFPADRRNYYVPDSLSTLDKEGCVQRALSIHAQIPYTKMVKKPDATDADIARGTDEVSVPLDENEIREMISDWYDAVMKEHGEE